MPLTHVTKLSFKHTITVAVLGTLAYINHCGAVTDVIKERYGRCSVEALDLGGYGGQENWSSLTVKNDGQILVGMSSRTHSAVLLTVDPETHSIRRVMQLDADGHLAPTQRQPKIHVTPVLGSDGWYHFVSHFGLETHLPLFGSRMGYEGMRRWRWNPKTQVAEHLGRIWDGEGAVALAVSNDGRRLFVVTFPLGLLLAIDLQTGTCRNYGRTNGVYPPRHILVNQRSDPHVLDHRGRFWHLDKAADSLSPLDVHLPATRSIPGNLLAQGFVSVTSTGKESMYYAMSAWGNLYRIDFIDKAIPTVTDLGNPADGIAYRSWRPVPRRITAAGLAITADGWLYIAISGYNKALDTSGDSYLIRCRNDGSESQLLACLDGSRISYICGSGAVDKKSGNIYFVGCHLIEDSPYLLIVRPLEQDN